MNKHLSLLCGEYVYCFKGHYLIPLGEDLISIEGYGTAKSFCKGFVAGKNSKKSPEYTLQVSTYIDTTKGNAKVYTVYMDNVNIFSSYSKKKIDLYIDGFNRGLKK